MNNYYKFLNKPTKGGIVKVYTQPPSVGVVIDVINKTLSFSKKKKEVAVLQRITNPLPANFVYDYYYDRGKVLFIDEIID